MNKWRQIANLQEKPSIEVKDWDLIQLRMSSSSVHYWVSCWVSGSMCAGRTCPGKDGSCGPSCDCSGEWFSIHAVSINGWGGAIKACDRVGIRYPGNKDNDEGWWISSRWAPDVYTAAVNTGESLSKSEIWQIYAAGKACGVPIEHSDVISFESVNGGYSLTTRALHSMFEQPRFGNSLKLDGPRTGSLPAFHSSAYIHKAYRKSFIIFKEGHYNSRYHW